MSLKSNISKNMRFKYFLFFVVFCTFSTVAECANSKSLLKIENQKILIEFPKRIFSLCKILTSYLRWTMANWNTAKVFV